MNSFDRLHPAVQHHIVNSLQWRQLRPLQEQAIRPLLAGEHALLLAPTAGGKTEAAIFPLLSRMLTEDWRGLSILYVCPIKALLNNLQERLERYAGLAGRRCDLWHGDISAGVKKKIRDDPPDILLTTPESLEVMLTSRRTDAAVLFRDVRAVVVDEIHAFAGDDRGWHLLSVLERVRRLVGREVQRIGLSATVGNPDGLLQWLSGHCDGVGRVINPPASDDARIEVQLDYVGNLDNAATVISRLHRGEKRLVFVDSRARVEELAARLRELGVDTYVSHSSLSVEERRQAEAAFSMGTDCVIVATSTLELGIDVGNLDRVIQIDAPARVSSFLQRMGRTGRREGGARNCLFLATSPEDLLHAAAVMELWESGYVEPVVPPAMPCHIFAQQIMALALQEQGVGRSRWPSWIGRLPEFKRLGDGVAESILAHMLATEVLAEDSGILWFGRAGEKRFGYRHFMEIFSVFTTPPLFRILHGRRELGSVDQISFVAGEEDRVLTLAGRHWQVTHVDWDRRVAYVDPTRLPGRSRWMGDGPPLGFDLCRAMCGLLQSEAMYGRWSIRAAAAMSRLRDEFAWVAGDATCLVSEGGTTRWWTFAGLLANATLAGVITDVLDVDCAADNLFISFSEPVAADRLGAVQQALGRSDCQPRLRHAAALVEHLKFSTCLPPDIGLAEVTARSLAIEDARTVAQMPLRQVVAADAS